MTTARCTDCKQVQQRLKRLDILPGLQSTAGGRPSSTCVSRASLSIEGVVDVWGRRERTGGGGGGGFKRWGAAHASEAVINLCLLRYSCGSKQYLASKHKGHCYWCDQAAAGRKVAVVAHNWHQAFLPELLRETQDTMDVVALYGG